MGRNRPKRVHKQASARSLKAKNRQKDLDEVLEEVAKVGETGIAGAFDPDLPGGGQFYCVYCSRHFVSEKALTSHVVSKIHKRRVKMLQSEQMYTQKDAEAAAEMTIKS